MPRLVFDIETDGLLGTCTKLHSLVVKDFDTGAVTSCCEPHNVTRKPYAPLTTGLTMLQTAEEIIGHNIIKFDVPALQKLYPWWSPEGKITDTLVLTRLIWSNIKDGDLGRVRQKLLPGKLIGSHSLEAWGYRLRRWKGDYSKVYEQKLKDIHAARGDEPPTPEEIIKFVWGSWNQDMQDYCEQDVEVTAELFQRCLNKEYPVSSTTLEHDAALLCAKIERNGFPFMEPQAVVLYGQLSGKRAELEQGLKKVFGSWAENKGEVTPKVALAAQGYWGDTYYFDRHGNRYEPGFDDFTPKGNLKQSVVKRLGLKRQFDGYPFTKVEFVEFNPASRAHIANRLTALYGWEPQEFTAEGQVKIDETILEGLDYPTAPLLKDYFLVIKRIGQLAEGQQAWLRVVREGKIHGGINPNGAVTGRATHSFPNIAQVPKVQATKAGILYGLEGGWGFECRSLFGVPPGWVQVGTDMSGLELRCLAHFMARWDEGEYANILLNGDIHTVNQEAAGLASRDNAKTFIYAYLYGAGDAKLGSITGGGQAEGKRLRANFQAKIPALGELSKAVKEAAARGYLVGLDGRHLHVRSAHSALNTLLQSAGALICKKWMTLLEQKLIARGYKHGWDGDFVFMAWVHDELQIAARSKEIADEIGQLSIECAREAGEFFSFRCPLTAEFKLGVNWAECH